MFYLISFQRNYKDILIDIYIFLLKKILILFQFFI